MIHKTLAELAAKISDIDIAIFSTKTDGGEIASRPMSNNSDVEYDGDSYYFTKQPTQLVTDIERDSKVSLAFSGKTGLPGGPADFFAAVEGEAQLIREKAAFKAHWKSELDGWFEQGVDTPGLVLIKVNAKRIKYWDGMDEGVVEVSASRAGTKAA